MANKVMTIEQIDQHLKNNPLRTAPVKVSASAPKQAQFNLCTTWNTVKPIIVFVTPLLFFKPSWQKIVNQFVASLDGYCSVK